jgi:hypothetical protein
MRRWLWSWKGNALLAWLAALVYAAATAWPHVFDGPIPLLGLRALGNPHLGVPLLAVTLAIAVFLSRPGWTSRDRLLVCAGAALCLFAVVAYAVAPSAALPFAFIGGNLLRENRGTGARRSPLWAETQ